MSLGALVAGGGGRIRQAGGRLWWVVVPFSPKNCLRQKLYQRKFYRVKFDTLWLLFN